MYGLSRESNYWMNALGTSEFDNLQYYHVFKTQRIELHFFYLGLKK